MEDSVNVKLEPSKLQQVTMILLWNKIVFLMLGPKVDATPDTNKNGKIWQGKSKVDTTSETSKNTYIASPTLLKLKVIGSICTCGHGSHNANSFNETLSSSLANITV